MHNDDIWASRGQMGYIRPKYGSFESPNWLTGYKKVYTEMPSRMVEDIIRNCNVSIPPSININGNCVEIEGVVYRRDRIVSISTINISTHLWGISVTIDNGQTKMVTCGRYTDKSKADEYVRDISEQIMNGNTTIELD